MAARLPLIAIVGPTASGKTALAIELAQKFNGEIICADSRTIYKGMDIGTAKPTAAEQAIVPHWGLDLVEPGERFTAANFKHYADQKIKEIRQRDHVPFLVGGTGLYVNSVLYDYSFQIDHDAEYRKKLESMTVEGLIQYCEKNNVQLPENSKNKRHLVRAIETKNVSKSVNTQLINNVIVVGIATNVTNEYVARVALRAETIIDGGVVEEATILSQKYGWDSEAMTGNIYPLVRQYIDGNMTHAELTERFITADRQLAKRQMTWFKRDPNIVWLSVNEARSYLTSVLSEHQS
jgi:tRNA dimethylallyltransferase